MTDQAKEELERLQAEVLARLATCTDAEAHTILKEYLQHYMQVLEKGEQEDGTETL